MDKQKRLRQLETECARVEQNLIRHNEVPGHPEFCSPASITIILRGDCGLGSAESAANIADVIPTPNLNMKQVLRELRRATKWMEYDLKLREIRQLKAELGQQQPSATDSRE